MKGDYSERMAFSQNPFAHTCKMHKSDQHFFGDNREISNSAVKRCPLFADFCRYCYNKDTGKIHNSQLWFTRAHT